MRSIVDGTSQPDALLGRATALVDQAEPRLHRRGEAGDHHLVLHLGDLLRQLLRHRGS
jgi:hypothetical protein